MWGNDFVSRGDIFRPWFVMPWVEFPRISSFGSLGSGIRLPGSLTPLFSDCITLVHFFLSLFLGYLISKTTLVVIVLLRVFCGGWDELITCNTRKIVPAHHQFNEKICLPTPPATFILLDQGSYWVLLRVQSVVWTLARGWNSSYNSLPR